jgi:hypothetical protein
MQNPRDPIQQRYPQPDWTRVAPDAWLLAKREARVLKVAIIVRCLGMRGCAHEMRATATNEFLKFGATPGSLELPECRELENEKSTTVPRSSG